MTVRLSWRRAVRPAEPGDAALPGTIAVSAVGVHVELGGLAVLDGVDLAVRHGEVVALVGPNGAGKSTLLSILSGDLTPDRGQVELGGRPVADWTTRELAMRRSVLLQQASVSFAFSVAETVRMGRFVWGDGDDDDRLVAAAMAATEVEHLADRDVTSLSGGERARAAMARVLAQDTPVMLLDEPTAALDLRHQEQLLVLAAERARNGVAVVVVLHDLTLAGAHADRVVVLGDGAIRADGPPSEVLVPELLGSVYDWPVEVLTHPETGAPIVVPVRVRPAEKKS
jgi:iron complex transport system ATP-binding protein